VFWLDIVEFIREEVIAILGMVFIAFFSQVSMEVRYCQVVVFYSTYCMCLIQITCLLYCASELYHCTFVANQHVSYSERDYCITYAKCLFMAHYYE